MRDLNTLGIVKLVNVSIYPLIEIEKTSTHDSDFQNTFHIRIDAGHLLFPHDLSRANHGQTPIALPGNCTGTYSLTLCLEICVICSMRPIEQLHADN